MRPKAILLDLDDTIISFDYGIDLDACWKKACLNHLPQRTETAIDDAVFAIKKQAKWYWSDAERHRTGRLAMDETRRQIVADALAAAGLEEQPSVPSRIADDYGLARDEAITLFPGAVDTLEYLRALGIKLALLTNGSSYGQRSKINRFQLAPYFDGIFIEEEFGVGKPDPAIYHGALLHLGVRPDETWMIGDNFEWEILAPQKLGIKGIWVNPRGLDSAAYNTQPFGSIGTLSEIVHLLK